MFLLDLQMTANTAASFLFLLANGNMQTESKKKSTKAHSFTVGAQRGVSMWMDVKVHLVM